LAIANRSHSGVSHSNGPCDASIPCWLVKCDKVVCTVTPVLSHQSSPIVEGTEDQSFLRIRRRAQRSRRLHLQTPLASYFVHSVTLFFLCLVILVFSCRTSDDHLPLDDVGALASACTLLVRSCPRTRAFTAGCLTSGTFVSSHHEPANKPRVKVALFCARSTFQRRQLSRARK
jgi:hypothetical protein